MKPDERARWREADAALDRLLDLPEVERDAALASMPEDLREPVRRLLRAHAQHGPLDTPLPEPEAGVPGRIGDWRLGAELGRGGMAVVHAAERDIPGGVQQGALKLLTVGALAADGRRRFLREQAVLARLSHPRIAALLDAGVLPDGTPWLVMQRIDGQRIDTWVRERRLLPRRIVQLGLQLCEAVAYAQRRLVVHRDLKPGNILVDADGGLHLLDFGVARLLDDSAAGEATATAARAFTPQYAAPEQFSGEDSGTAIDVYGLGAVLFQLLTGSLPQPGGGADSVTRRPSRAAQGANTLAAEQRPLFARQLRGDLDAVLLKALDPDPARRYPDAAALGEDLQRWLDQRPVLAARHGPGRRLALWVRRHRVAAALGLLLVLSIASGLAATLWQSAIARAEAERARQEATRATAAREFLLSLFTAADPLRPGGTLRDTGEVFRLAAKRVREDDALPPSLRLELMATVADVQRSLGELDDARATLVDADALLGRHGEAAFEPRVRARLALEHMRLAVEAREFDSIRRHAAETLRLVADGVDEESLRARASAQLQIAYAAIQLGAYDDAQAALDAAEIEIAAIEPEALQLRGHLAASRGHLAYVTDRMPEALGHMQAAYAYEERLGNAESASSIGKLGNLSAVSAMLGRLDDAEAYDRKALAIARSVYPEGNVAIARVLYGLGDILRQRGRFDQALPMLEEARRIQSDAGTGGEGEVDLVDLVRLRVLVSLDRGVEALGLADALIPKLAARWGEGSREVLLASEQALAAASRLGRRESEASLARDAEARLTALGADGRHSLAQQLRWRLGEVARQRGDAVEARRWLEDAGPVTTEDLARSATPSLRLKALALHLASDAARIDGARELAADTAAAEGASQDALLYAWLAVIEAATKADPALAQDALRRATALVASHPPSADLRERIEAVAASAAR